MSSQQVEYFKAYHLLVRLNAEIVTVSPLRVGAGKGTDIGEPDLPILRLNDGRAVIPGSSLKGIFRSTVARILNKNSEDIYYLFGGKVSNGGNQEVSIGSPLIFDDFISDHVIPSLERSHIKINPKSGGVQHLFQVEYVPNNVKFYGNILARNLAPLTLGYIVSAVKALMDQRIVKVGGFKSRGYGAVSFSLKEVSFLVPSKSSSFKTRFTRNGNETEVKIEIVDGNKLKVTEGSTTKEIPVKAVDEKPLFVNIKVDPESFINLNFGD
ncbi:hypothetical protein CM19_13045 [Candidatus Acidianus copahuensis]|uniref:CRISPR type III-associated protein domain-containing protein n=1 Tax=Candidatus Acidianus copahuensis TaxID=1160895 RepID=A0A031LKW5_9CREN|nr:RAMP superfamily CRISPR-associated protein [Candidatus Acidianus copahuensis]EZQ01538.1 hypothetical protein CM19_13045 [Candidatus Acidianus copahuensis]